MNILFVEPAFPHTQRQFPRALKDVGAHVIGIGERPWEQLDDELRWWLGGYEQIGSVTDVDQLEAAVRRVQQRLWVDRLEATIESHVLPAAVVRERCGVPGTSVRTAHLCRDKAVMKDVLREAGVPCAASERVDEPAALRAFAARHGAPLILKPLDSAGAEATYRIDSGEQLDGAIAASHLGTGRAFIVEEFNDGHEGFYDTLCLDGTVVHDFASHYFPNVLEAMRTRWVSPQIVCTNRIDQDEAIYAEIRAMAERVHQVLGIGTTATHMEWFYGPKGLRFSEIGCRPPGVGVWDLYCAANEVDIYAEWARLIVHGGTDTAMSRRYAVGQIALRPDADGWISGYSGIDEVRQRHGAHLIGEGLPQPGTATQPVDHGYHANAWLAARHSDYDTLRGILDDIGRTVHVYAQG